MVGGRDVVRVLNGSAFHDTQLVCNGDLSYLGGSWSRTIGSAVSDLTVFLFYGSCWMTNVCIRALFSAMGFCYMALLPFK
jgi:hypothetical protein